MILFSGDNIKADYLKLAYDFKFKGLDGSELSLDEFKDKVIVVVNVQVSVVLLNNMKICKRYGTNTRVKD